MPCESSSQISNSTNGIEPPRGFVSIKQSKDGILKQVVPEYEKLRNQYELLWDIKDNEGYLSYVQLCKNLLTSLSPLIHIMTPPNMTATECR